MKIQEALKELKKDKRKFSQSIDLIINLRKIDVRKNPINLFLQVPHKIKDVKVAGFLEEKSNILDTITEKDFSKYKEKKDIRKLAKKYDYLISNAKLMPKVASVFGRVLGPKGRMPSPQTGILTKESDDEIKKIIEKLNKSVKIRAKEPSIKVRIGTEEMKEEEIEENIKIVYNGVLKVLPNNKENVKDILIKLTMSKAIKIEL